MPTIPRSTCSTAATIAGNTGAIGAQTARMPAQTCRHRIEPDPAAGEIARDGGGRVHALAPDRQRPRGPPRIMVAIMARSVIVTRPAVGAPIEQSAAPQLREYVEPIAAGPALNE